MKFYRLKKPSGESNFVSAEAIQWIESDGTSSIIHLDGGAAIRSGMPSEDLVRALSVDPKTTAPKPTVPPPAVVPAPPTEPPAIDFARVKAVKPVKEKVE